MIVKPIKVLLCIIVLLASSFAAVSSEAPITYFEQKIARLKGQVIYVDFWASWCGPCRQSFPWMNKVQQQYSKEGFTVISVNVDAERKFADEFLIKYPASFPVIYDPEGKLARKLKVSGMPNSFLINREGDIVSRHVGFNDQKKKAYEQEIIKWLAR